MDSLLYIASLLCGRVSKANKCKAETRTQEFDIQEFYWLSRSMSHPAAAPNSKKRSLLVFSPIRKLEEKIRQNIDRTDKNPPAVIFGK